MIYNASTKLKPLSTQYYVECIRPLKYKEIHSLRVWSKLKYYPRYISIAFHFLLVGYRYVERLPKRLRF